MQVRWVDQIDEDDMSLDSAKENLHRASVVSDRMTSDLLPIPKVEDSVVKKKGH